MLYTLFKTKENISYFLWLNTINYFQPEQNCIEIQMSRDVLGLGSYIQGIFKSFNTMDLIRNTFIR